VSSATVAFLEPDESWLSHVSQIKHSQRFQGSYLLSLERPTRFPENSRSYIKGDPVALVDWKAFARSDQLIVREQRDEASIHVKIGIDTSDTMMWPTEQLLTEHNCGGPTKWEIAVRIGFNLANQHLKIGDTVEIIMTDPSDESSISVKRNTDLLSLYDLIRSNDFLYSKNTALINEAKSPQNKKKRHDRGYWLSDAIIKDNSRDLFFESCKRKTFFHTLHSMELNTFWMKKPSSYFDKEPSPKELPGDQLKNSSAYQRSLAKWQEQIQKSSESADCSYISLTEKTPIDDLREMLYHSFAE